MGTKTLFNLVVITIVVRYIYYPITNNKDYLFTYFLISLTVLLLCILLDIVKLQLGFALGLFAIFGIIRYRTDPIAIKEMTYLFLVIGISVINALSNKKISHAELLFANLLIVFITYGILWSCFLFARFSLGLLCFCWFLLCFARFSSGLSMSGR